MGIYNVVVSNKKGGNLRQEVSHMGWDGLFDKVVGADDAARDKPHPDPVHMAFEGAPLMPSRDVWFVGDSEIDIECADNTGCTAILYGPLAKEQKEYSQTHYYGFPYHAYVEDHTQLLALLQK
jgi:phosphoglycolate phosphatase